jgi:hypothetical protein
MMPLKLLIYEALAKTQLSPPRLLEGSNSRRGKKKGSITAIRQGRMKTRKGALAVLIFAAATLGIIMVADQQQARRAAVLVQLLPDSQISDAIKV